MNPPCWTPEEWAATKTTDQQEVAQDVVGAIQQAADEFYFKHLRIHDFQFGLGDTLIVFPDANGVLWRLRLERVLPG